MTVMLWAVRAMTAVCAGATLYLAANGGDVGLVFMGLGVSVGGIFVVALIPEIKERDE